MDRPSPASLLLLIAALGACGGSDPARPAPPFRSGSSSGGDAPLPAAPCELARATELSCLSDQAGACEADPSCGRVCYPFTLAVQELCPDAAPGPCAELAAQVEACFREAEVDCSDLKSALQLAEYQATRACGPLEADPPSYDPAVRKACNEAIAACWQPRDAFDSCRAPCRDLAARAAGVCAGA
jgi:hypothetical protein